LYPIIEAFTSYFPGGMFIMKKFPSKSVAAPKVVPIIITLAPIRGSPFEESIIFPEIFPVVPAKDLILKIIRKNRMATKKNFKCFLIIVKCF
jgi:hypothetical protein